jgi:hypothetical protein
MPPDQSLDRPSDDSSADWLADSRAARPPAELLDNLRLRLCDLPGNHPSAIRAADASPARDADHAGPAEPAPGELREPTDTADADDPSGGGGESLTELIRAVREAGDGLSWAADTDLLGEMDLFSGGGSGDPYRPWFMSGEPGAPWFVAGEDR